MFMATKWSRQLTHKLHMSIQIPNLLFSGIPWLSQVNCTGQESYLGRCGNIRWGFVRDCRSDMHAGVYCYQKSGMSEINCIWKSVEFQVLKYQNVYRLISIDV